jgi:hypothetical protein
VAIQTIKSVARRRWVPSDEGSHFSWYRPLEDTAAIGRAVRYVLSRPELFLNTSSDARLLRPTVSALGSPAPTDAEMEADVAEFGIQPLFDGADLERI